MEFPGQATIDAIILTGSTIFTFVSIAYIALLWSMRRDFYVVLRSPLLTCTFGLFAVLRYIATTYEYVFIWRGDDIGTDGVVDLVGFPALLAAEIALILTAVRLLVMYYPSKRARWGRYIKEKSLVRALVCAWVLMEIAVWSAAWAVGIPRTASVVQTVARSSLIFTVLAATWLAYQLKNVHDSTNLSRDIGLVGRVFVVIFVIFAALMLLPNPYPLVFKYANIVFQSISSPPIVYLINIRPVREILRQTREGGRSTVQKILAPRHQRAPSNMMDEVERGQSRAGCADEDRIAAIMRFHPLTLAFGEICRKALCSESFEFLVDVTKFKAIDRILEGGNGEIFLDYTRFLAIVNCYIKYDSHLEINIGSNTKRDIMDFTKFEEYASLDPDKRKEIFNPAELEIIKLLKENLLSKFLASEEYKAVVHLESS